MRYLRVINYLFVLAIGWVLARPVNVSEVSLNSPNALLGLKALGKNALIFQPGDIFGATQSGREILRRAEAYLTAHNLNGCVSYIPYYKIESIDGTLFWILEFERPEVPPGERPGFITLAIDDSNGTVYRRH